MIKFYYYITPAGGSRFTLDFYGHALETNKRITTFGVIASHERVKYKGEMEVVWERIRWLQESGCQFAIYSVAEFRGVSLLVIEVEEDYAVEYKLRWS